MLRVVAIIIIFCCRLFLCLLWSSPLTTSIIPTALAFAPVTTWQKNRRIRDRSTGQQRLLFATSSSSSSNIDLIDPTTAATIDELNAILQGGDLSGGIIKMCKLKIGSSSVHGGGGWGLIAAQNVKAGESVLQIPFDETFEITRASALKVFADYLPNSSQKNDKNNNDDRSFDSWTGDVGLMALQLLNERARYYKAGGIPLQSKQQQQQPDARQRLLGLWLSLLPADDKMDHPLLWNEEDQEVLQSSTTNKIYRRLDDLEEDFQWLTDTIFSKDRSTFPETVSDKNIPCFSIKGFQWAMSIVQSRSFFLDGALRLIPIIDFLNHDDAAKELSSTTSMGLFGSIKGTTVLTSRAVAAGEEVLISYGPKSGAEYLLEHGFIPSACCKNPVVELTLEIDPNDRFYDDKLDILEFETYELAPMDPIQKFDVVSNGPPDPAMIQFLRLRALAKFDAFLLESIFRKEAWGFMAYPVSEVNELAVVEYLLRVCRTTLDEFAACPKGGPDICRQLRASETAVLERLITIMEQEKQGLDLKEYYQERRLKDLGLDSVWTPEDDIMEANDLSYGQTRAPGGADYDW